MLDRFTAIIDAFEDTSAGLTLDQIAARAHLPRSTTHRILDQLVRLQWLTHSGRGYRLGARTSAWGSGDSADVRLRSVAATIGSRAAIGIVTSDRVLAQRCQPLVSASAARIARALAGATN